MLMRYTMNIFKKAITVSVCAAAVSACALMQTTAFAELSLNAKFDYGSQTVTVSGAADSVNAPVLVRVLPQNVSAAELTESDINSNQYPMLTLFSDKQGGYKAEFIFPDMCGGGVYNVYAASYENEAVQSFAYYKKSEIAELARLLNNADAAEAEAVLQNAADSGSLFIEEFDNNKKMIAQLVCLNRPSGGYNADNLIDELRRSATVSMIRSGNPLDSEKLISDYADSFGISYEADYKELSQRVKNDFLEEVRKCPLSESTRNMVLHSLIYAGVKNCETYVELRNIAEKYIAEIGINADEYNSLSDSKKTNVFSKLISKNISGFYDIEPQITALIKSEKQTTGGSTGGTGGGSGGSSQKGLSGGYSVDSGAAQNNGHDTLFPDIQSHWSRDVVEKMVKKGIVTGFEDGTFRPGQAVTRAEFTALAAKAFKLDSAAESAFADCAPSDWYTPFVSAAYGAGLVTGNGNGSFSPNSPITREDCCVILCRALMSRQRVLQGEKEFSDAAEAAPYAREAIAKMAANGIVNGFNNAFMPKNNTTRAEACTMIYNVLTYLGEAE